MTFINLGIQKKLTRPDLMHLMKFMGVASEMHYCLQPAVFLMASRWRLHWFHEEAKWCGDKLTPLDL